MSSRQPPWTWGEGDSDANPAQQQITLMGDGSLHHYLPPGSLRGEIDGAHVPLTHSMSEAHASDSNARNFNSFAASNQPSTKLRPHYTRSGANEPIPENRPGV